MSCPNITPLPSDAGFLSWAFDPAAITNSLALTNGSINLLRISTTRPIVVSKLCFANNNAAGTMTAGQNWIGLYSGNNQPTGRLLASASLDTETAAGLHQMTVPAVTIPTGWFYMAFLVNLSVGTYQSCIGLNSGNARLTFSGLLPASQARSATNIVATSLPSVLDYSLNTTSIIPLWGAVG